MKRTSGHRGMHAVVSVGTPSAAQTLTRRSELRTDSADAFADPGFRRLWAAMLLAQSGSAMGTVGIPLVAIGELGLGAGTVALMAAVSAVVLALAALPAGYHAEFHRKRPVMVRSDAVRSAGFGVLAVLLVTGHLHVAWMFVVLGLNAVAQILFQSAASAFVKSLLGTRARADGMGKLQAATWFSLILGPVLAGVLAAATTPAVLLAINAATFALSALLISRIPRREETVPVPDAGTRRVVAALSGARFLLEDRLLRRLLVSWLIFAGAVAALTPLTQVFTLQELRFTPAQYGLLMGIPSVGGLAGAWIAGRAAARWGVGPVIIWSSALRIPFYCAYPVAPPGDVGLVVLIAGFTGVLFFSSITNSSMGALRMDVTPDRLMARSSSAWSLATMGAGPVLIPILGAVAHAADVRVALWVVVLLVVVSVLVLPTRALTQFRASA